MRHPGIDKIAFTGSTATGVAIVRDSADHLPRVSLELGGKAPNVVLADADLDGALSGALAGIFAATGQTCIAGSRLLVQRTIHDEFVRRLAERAAQIRLGDPMLDDTEMGPVAFEEHRENVMRYIDIGRSEGAEVVTGGNRPQDPAPRNGCFVEPTVLVDVTNDMRVAREEIFGPVVAVIPFETEREAIEIANSTPFGLGRWRLDHRCAPGAPCRARDQGRFGLDQLVSGGVVRCAVRGIWHERLGARERRRGGSGVHRDEDGLGRAHRRAGGSLQAPLTKRAATAAPTGGGAAVFRATEACEGPLSQVRIPPA